VRANGLTIPKMQALLASCQGHGDGDGDGGVEERARVDDDLFGEAAAIFQGFIDFVSLRP